MRWTEEEIEALELGGAGLKLGGGVRIIGTMHVIVICGRTFAIKYYLYLEWRTSLWYSSRRVEDMNDYGMPGMYSLLFRGLLFPITSIITAGSVVILMCYRSRREWRNINKHHHVFLLCQTSF